MIPRVKSKAHLDFIRSLCCIICGDQTTVEAAHLRFSDARAAKPITGAGTKPSDSWCVPLCGRHHREQHASGERKWWESKGIDPIFVCLALYRISGDHEAGLQIIQANQSKHAYPVATHKR